MLSIRIHQLTKRFGEVVALDALSLEIRPGELFFLLGPSGCGKTTLLRSLAGFYEPDAGAIYFGAEDVTRVPPHQRQTGMVFQSYALWPHLTVVQNVAFGLEERGMPRAEIERRVAEALGSVDLAGLGARRPNELSGGQQQRVALARALVVRPRCLLLDEPLSNLDARLRLEMRGEIRRIAKEFNLTTVYVTHDQKEALSIADRIAVLDRGRVLQVGTPVEIYRRPDNRTVATFIGETDLLPGRLERLNNGEAYVATVHGAFRGVAGASARPLTPGAAVVLSVRPEAWRIGNEGGSENTVQGRIGRAVFLGEMAQFDLRTGGTTLRVFELNPRMTERADGTPVTATARQEDVVVLSAD